MRMFTAYDGTNKFGDTSIRAISSDQAQASVYASVDAANPGRMVIVAINKTANALSASISLAAYANYSSASVFQLTSASSTIQSGGTINAQSKNGFLYQMPAYSLSVLVPR
jgi:hypothetical protein